MVTLQFIILTDNVYRKKRFVLDYVRDNILWHNLDNASEDLTMAMRECGLFSWQYRNMASDYKQAELAYSLYLKRIVKVHSRLLL